jgi:hypothetical protein
MVYELWVNNPLVLGWMCASEPTVEAIPTKRAIDSVVKYFIGESIITIFGVSAEITSDNDKTLSFANFSSFFFDYDIILSHSSNYYPQGSGLVESNNKSLTTIIKKI